MSAFPRVELVKGPALIEGETKVTTSPDPQSPERVRLRVERPVWFVPEGETWELVRAAPSDEAAP